MTIDDEDLVARIRQALKVVIDPELGHNIVDLGFVYDVSIDDGAAHITMTATTRGCPAASFLKEGVANSASLVPGVDTVDVTMTFEPPWQPSMISPGVKSSLGFAEVN
ncbi:aromatic ring hydroxylase [Bradyrhizobium nitroreducens]|uniref:Aromatic ring hydroxylase n=1 Tax=Bradyrhizobium nitroreducens TaxID=709803 RepID=A0A2M6UG57_9BRAD|nr:MULTISPECIES: metal-sulfur cluster assembly factor [Bradyrhizobium]PIT03602.1 aromatic ring hydroxylase [Bradyrhizobium nitroreducens]TQF27982.1 aromatic ring hydroxylase [Bradyrhizobium sp. UNPF46]